MAWMPLVLITIEGGKFSDFKNPVTTLTGQTVDLETYQEGNIAFWHVFWYVFGLAWILYWVRRPVFLPRYLLVEAGHKVAVVDNLATGRAANLNPWARLHEVDVESPLLLKVLQAERPDVVVSDVQAQNAERRRIAADLHDSVVQDLAERGGGRAHRIEAAKTPAHTMSRVTAQKSAAETERVASQASHGTPSSRGRHSRARQAAQ